MSTIIETDENGREEYKGARESLEDFLARLPSGDPKPEDRYIWNGDTIVITHRANTCPSCGAKSPGDVTCRICRERTGEDFGNEAVEVLV